MSSSKKQSGEVRASHILIKHEGSRRKSSWKDPEGYIIKNTTRESTVAQLKAMRNDIVSGKANFEDIASRYSDCSSAKRGGDLVGTWDATFNQNKTPRNGSSKMANPKRSHYYLITILIVFIASMIDNALCIRFPDRVAQPARDLPDQQNLQTAVFALGSFWRSEAVFGCLPGVIRTTVGYAGGSKPNPEYRNLGDHAESVQVEYDPQLTSFRELLDIFWSSHDPRQVYGQGPDVGNQYRSIIFVNGTEESRMASVSKEQEQTRSRSSIVTTQVLQLEAFYPAEPEHQKFELKQNSFLLQLIGNLPAEELERSSLATKLNGYVAELCPPNIQKQIDSKINEILKKGWPILREL